MVRRVVFSLASMSVIALGWPFELQQAIQNQLDFHSRQEIKLRLQAFSFAHCFIKWR